LGGGLAQSEDDRSATSTLVVDEVRPNAGSRFGAEVPARWFSVLTVADEGVGRDEEILAHIFEPFFTIKARGKGTGLGLATLYGIVTQTGGYITAETFAGCGSTFRIQLPGFPADATPSAPKSAPAASEGHDETILVVEDEAAVRALGAKVAEVLRLPA